jgi:hypothetical protein
MASGVNFGTQQYFGFDPRTIPSCALWLDAADSTTMTLSGSSVTQWRDKSGNGNATTTATGPPTITTASLNGLSGINLSSSPARCFQMQPLTNPANQTTLTAFMVMSMANSAVAYCRWLSVSKVSDGTANTDYSTVPSFIFCRDNLFQEIDVYRNGLNIGGLPITYNQPFALSCVFDGTTARPFMNGTAQTTFASSGTFGFDRLAIGQNSGLAGVELCDGLVYEVILYYTDLTTSQRQQVEGYLARKWGLTANLPTSHPYKSYPPAMRIFQPVDIAGASLWLDAADATTLTLSGSSVTSWTDKTGTTSLTQSTSSLRPVYTSTGFNGRPAVQFTGVQGASYQYLQSATTSVYNSISSFTFFAVMRIVSTPPVFPSPISLQNKVSFYLRGLNNSSGFTGDNMWTYQGSTFVASPNTIFPYDTDTISCLALGSTQQFFLNGSTTISSPSFTFGTGTNLSLLLGWSGYNANDGFNGYMSEVIVYTSPLSTSQRQQVEGYLAQKWGLQTTLPTTHPYYRVLPSTPVFTPTALSGCVLWMDPTDSTTLTLSGSSVTQWRDKSASDATFTTVNANPTYNASLINGLPALDLTNGSGFISSTTQTLTSSLTLAMVLVVKSGLGFWGSFFTHGNRDTDIALERNSISSGTTLHFQTANDNSTGDITFTTDQVSLYLGTMTTGTSRFFERFGGGTTTTTSATNSSTIVTGLQTIRIGRSDVGENCNSFIGEIVYYNRVLTTQERQQLEAYLMWKWGLTPSLPSTHPYSKFRP